MRMFEHRIGDRSWVIRPEYTDAEIEGAWSKQGQGHERAVSRDEQFCVVMCCDKETAIMMSRLFLREFNMSTCVHYDGNTLSMNCAEASRDMGALKKCILAIRPWMH